MYEVLITITSQAEIGNVLFRYGMRSLIKFDRLQTTATSHLSITPSSPVEQRARLAVAFKTSLSSVFFEPQK